MKRFLFMFSTVALLGTAMVAFKPVRPVSANATARALTLQTGKWAIDKVHTNVLFSVSHLVVSDVEGSFKAFDGSMENTKADFSDAKIAFSVDVSSVNTDNEMRDKHLKSDDFFNAEKFPQMKFVSTSFTPAGDGKYKLTGNLTIRDMTKTVTFDVKYGGMVSAMGGTHIGFKAKTTLNRFDYNLKWSKATEAGGLVVGKDVDVTINLDLKKEG